MYQREVDVDMLNAVKSLLADISSVSPSSEQKLVLTGTSIPLYLEGSLIIYNVICKLFQS